MNSTKHIYFISGSHACKVFRSYGCELNDLSIEHLKECEYDLHKLELTKEDMRKAIELAKYYDMEEISKEDYQTLNK